MKKRYMHLGVGSALLFLGTSVSGADFSRPPHNPFASRIQRGQITQKKEVEKAKSLYPESFNARQIESIINAPFKTVKISSRLTITKREAVALNDETLGEIKVSSKTENNLLNAIKNAIAEDVINGTVDEIISLSDNTSITVHPEVEAIFKGYTQVNYQGGTSSEEEAKTGKKKKGQLLEYLLCKNGRPIPFVGPHATQPSSAKLILSVTSTPQEK